MSIEYTDHSKPAEDATFDDAEAKRLEQAVFAGNMRAHRAKHGIPDPADLDRTKRLLQAAIDKQDRASRRRGDPDRYEYASPISGVDDADLRKATASAAKFMKAHKMLGDGDEPDVEFDQ